jgi:hypothetical protein
MPVAAIRNFATCEIEIGSARLLLGFVHRNLLFYEKDAPACERMNQFLPIIENLNR